MPPAKSLRGLPKLTITITAAPPGAVCRNGPEHPATEHYEFSDHGAAIDRCAAHGGDKMRKALRAKGHRIVDRVAS